MLVAEAVLATSLLALAPEPASTQFFDDRFPFQNRWQRESFDWSEPAPLERPRERAAPQQDRMPLDYSKAPAPKKADPKAEAAVTTAIMVCESASNFAPRPIRRKCLTDHNFIANGWGPDWTPIKSSYDLKFRC
jgi:hypothetical protein